MKSRTLAMITAAIITTAAIILTAGLSLLHSSATGEDTIPDESLVPVSEIPKAETQNTDIPEIHEEELEAQEHEETEFDIGVTCTDENCDYPHHFYLDVAVAIYEHATGKLVSQKIYTEDDIWHDINELHLDVYDRGECIYSPAGGEGQEMTPVYIPEAKYRVEVFAIWYADEDGSGELSFAYSYGADSDLIEMWGSGVLYSGGDLFISYVDGLIADQMAELEAGEAIAPTEEEAITSIIGFDIIELSAAPFSKSVWTGDFYGAFDRKIPRFPYLKD